MPKRRQLPPVGVEPTNDPIALPSRSLGRSAGVQDRYRKMAVSFVRVLERD